MHFKINNVTLYLFPDITQVILSNIQQEAGAILILISYTNKISFLLEFFNFFGDLRFMCFSSVWTCVNASIFLHL